ncbi:hypothetical protein THMIRHAM_04860 [Thiomicrorhabdus immobilis]|uniref:Uncharacterized protein n=1 Tax=Thiomicrorhabdus immobilis TaxID=2791037 RepID=A0ABM7MBH7_9GAMM|nr:hypothetical protein THMIRHAM_04860 [Thiomicrorhabdus immobilis]
MFLNGRYFTNLTPRANKNINDNNVTIPEAVYSTLPYEAGIKKKPISHNSQANTNIFIGCKLFIVNFN